MSVMCEVLEVSRSGFYAWHKRPESQRSQINRQLVEEIQEIHQDRDLKNYGSPRMWGELNARGHQVSENTVAKLMREHELRAASSRKFKATTNSRHDHPVAENLLDRQFEQESPDQVWLSDITYLWTEEGWLYLACVLDCCTRRIVGYSMGERITQDLVLSALEMALSRREPSEGLMLHSDRGSQYASGTVQQRLREAHITCSMSRKGNCWDNAMMESFFASLKKERCHQERYRTRAEARASVFDYIERFYNRQRRHSALGGMSPEQYEQSL